MNLIRFSLKNPLLMNLISVMILGIGLYKAIQMNKEAFPSIDFDIVSISAVYPGASPKEVELYVTNPIEKELSTVDGLEEVTSTSVEGMSIIIVKLDPDRSEDDKIKAANDIQRAVDRVRDLPDDLPEAPLVRSSTSGDMPVLELSLTGDVPYAELQKVAEKLKDHLELIPDVKEAHLNGFREKEFWIELSPEKLQQYSVGLTQVVASLATRNVNLPGGVLKSSNGDLLVRTIGEVKTAPEMEKIVVRANDAGISIKISDLGKVRETFEEEIRVFRTDGSSSINMMITKKSRGDIISLVDKVKEATPAYLELIGASNLKVQYMNDLSVFVRNRLGVLLNNSYVGMGLVIISLLLFLSKGIALVTAAGMPIAMLGTLAFMGYTDTTINLISMFGLVIVLGMLVDDAIIVAENIWQHFERGSNAFDACLNGTTEVFWPVTATILTTCAAFSPLMMVSGIFGKFIKILPEVVIIALLFSLLEAMLILPSHGYDVLRIIERIHKKKKEKGKEVKHGGGIVDAVIELYGRFLGFSLKTRYLTLGAFLAIFAGSLMFAKTKMKTILFPSDGIEVFFVRAELPRNSSLNYTADVFKVLEAEVAKLPAKELSTFVTHIGIQRDEPNDPFTKRGSHLGQIQVFLTPERDRDRVAEEIIEQLRDAVTKIAPDYKLSGLYFNKQRMGPPVGKPVAIRVSGDNLDELDKISTIVMGELGKVNGVTDISRNFNPGKDELQIVIDEEAASKALLSVKDIALHIRTAIDGTIATYVRDEGDRIAVRVRYPESARQEMSSITESRVANRMGYLVPVSSVAHVERKPGLDAIIHRDFKREVTVSANIDEQVTTSTVVNKLMIDKIKKIDKEYPTVSVKAGGEFEDTEKSMQSLAEAFLVAMFLIFLILATLFRSLTQPIVVMAAIPFGIIGVIVAFYAHNMPLSFIGLVGVIGLSGVVVNDSIVLVSFINNARNEGMSAFDAAIHAGKRRFRAVWLTSITTILGVLPLAYGIGGEDKFLRPAAMALGYGLIFSTVLILVMVPSIYLVRIDIGRAGLWIWRKIMSVVRLVVPAG